MKQKYLNLFFAVFAFFAYNVPDTHPAIRFLNSLDEQQLFNAQKPFNYSYKENWHYVPASILPRGGLSLANMTAHQKDLIHELLSVSLSEVGYNKIKRIIELESVLREIQGDSVMRDPDNYIVRFFGNPKKDSLWSWSFQGHHLSLFFTTLNNKTTIAPRFMGASPAMIKEGPRKGERTLEKEEDLGLELINSLSDGQRQSAIFKQNPFFDIVTKNSIEVGPLSPVGIRYEQLNIEQKSILLKLIDEYLSVMPKEVADKRIKLLMDEELNDIRFGWAGGTSRGIGHYYRIQGKSFLVEYDNTQGKANHIHTVWRDFDGDFGRDLIREHYLNSNHH